METIADVTSEDFPLI